MSELAGAYAGGSNREQKRMAKAKKNAAAGVGAGAGAPQDASQGAGEPRVSKKKRAKEQQQHQPHQPDAPVSNSEAIKKLLMLFGGLGVTVVGVPFAIALLGRFIVGREVLLYALWAAMIGAGLYAFFVVHKERTTWNHLAEALMYWGIITFGSYQMIDIPRFTQGAFTVLDSFFGGQPAALESLSRNEQYQVIHRLVLWLWCTVSMMGGVAFFFYDTHNYQKTEAKLTAKEEKERKKEQDREQRRLDKKNAAREKAIAEGTFDPEKRKRNDRILKVAVILSALWGLFRAANYLIEYQEYLNNIHMDNKIG